MEENHLVSIGILAYNRPEGLRRTLECITEQTYKNLEIIISNNCSPDPGVEAVALEFMEKDPRIQYFCQEENKGGFFNFGFVLEKATGEYFMWASDDDEWDPRFVQVCVDKLNTNPRYGLVFTRYDITSPYDKKKVNLNHNRYLRTKHRKAVFLLLDECLTHKANMSFGVWRRETINRVMQRAISCGLSEEHMGYGFDQAFLLLTLDETDIYQVQEVLFTKRYTDRLIPGSCRAILMDTLGNLIHAIRHPVIHIKNSIVRSGQYMEVIERVYKEDDRISKSLIFFVKRIQHIFLRYIL
jgi:glycosyltransferase involved in cell wall biosynthesis